MNERDHGSFSANQEKSEPIPPSSADDQQPPSDAAPADTDLPEDSTSSRPRWTSGEASSTGPTDAVANPGVPAVAPPGKPDGEVDTRLG